MVVVEMAMLEVLATMLPYLDVESTKTTERGGGGESVVYKLKQCYTF
jgi:hypothetical protein